MTDVIDGVEMIAVEVMTFDSTDDECQSSLLLSHRLHRTTVTTHNTDHTERHVHVNRRTVLLLLCTPSGVASLWEHGRMPPPPHSWNFVFRV